MIRKLFKYLLIGLSSMTLLAGAQQGLFTKQSADFVLAEGEECADGEVCPGGSAHRTIVSSECSDPNTPQTQECSDSLGTGHKYCTWTAEGNKWGNCRIEACYNGQTPPACVAPLVAGGDSNSPWECQRALARNENICNDNVIYCENSTDGSRNSMMVVKHEGVCNPYSGERDSRGCIFQYQKNDPQPLLCSERGQQPQQPAQQVQQVVAQPQQGFVCDNSGFADGQGRWRQAEFPANQSLPACEVNNANTFAGCKDGGAAAGNICQTVQQPLVVPPVSCPSGSALINGVCQPNIACPANTTLVNGVCQGTITCPSGTTLVNGVCQGAVIQVATAECPSGYTKTVSGNTIVCYPPPGGLGGNVGIGTTVYVQPAQVQYQPVQYVAATQLPKTGLPAFTWSALAFLPAGLRMRRFSKIKKALENHPNYIFEDRQFKSGY